MVQVSHTSASRKVLCAYASGISHDDIPDPQAASIDHIEIANVVRSLTLQDPLSEPFHGLDILLRGTSIYIPKPPPKTKQSEGYFALMERLRREQEENSYAAMLGTNKKDDDIHSITKEISDQISVILNMLFSSIFMGLAIWYATANLSTYRNRESLRVGASIAVAFVVAAAEISLYSSYIRKMEDAKTRERSQPEIKTLVKKPAGEND
ncbi:hypothetical protein H072_5876 [Dactylellina haptotyla CBS 200.50]|uniref:Endoplasmic reticulum-based factor for assembly of V-ATPase n=1 Tax=Dactylellina haptotyla (strain CBS 200.50) TaxID=1284197 RepID=S8ABN8_DACHA|nr:hypothetical protein H072_5876 [Dactylellina haptotyla CBS 200.50]